MELLTPSERELANGHMLTSEATQKEKESSKRAKFASHLKIKTSKNNKAPHDAGANNVGRPELDARQAQKSFKLTFQQLAYVHCSFWYYRPTHYRYQVEH
jgi:hypothetical protein